MQDTGPPGTGLDTPVQVTKPHNLRGFSCQLTVEVNSVVMTSATNGADFTALIIDFLLVTSPLKVHTPATLQTALTRDPQSACRHFYNPLEAVQLVHGVAGHMVSKLPQHICNPVSIVDLKSCLHLCSQHQDYSLKYFKLPTERCIPQHDKSSSLLYQT